MNVKELKEVLAQFAQVPLRFILPNGEKVPAHAHVTEVARIDKRFVDCGGTLRNDERCQLQTWVAEDFDHRLTADKLLGILNKASSLLGSDHLEIDVEHETQWISQFPLDAARLDGSELTLTLGVRHTACLAMEKCVPPPSVLSINFGKLPTFTSRP